MFFKKRHHNLLSARRLHGSAKHDSGRSAAATAVTALLVVLLAAAAVVAPFWYLGASVYARANAGKDALAAAETAAHALDIPTALERTAAADADFAAAQRDLAKLAPLRMLPGVGTGIIAADRILVSGRASAAAARDVLGAARDVLAALPSGTVRFETITHEQTRGILAALASDAPALRDAMTQLDAALAALDEVPDTGVAATLGPVLAGEREKLITFRQQLGAALPLAELAPAALGYPTERHYLVFFENNTELRPTGGFLGLYGLVTVKDGQLASLRTNDVYALDGPSEKTPRPAPPAPLRAYLGVDRWFLRDANWSPDFTVASSVMTQFYKEEATAAYGSSAITDIDGVLAFTPSFAADILRATGPVTVDGETFDADNLVDALEFQVERAFRTQGVPASQRKGIVGDLAKEVINRLSTMSLPQLLAVAATAGRDLDEKQMLLSMNEPQLEAMILARGWGGALRPVDDDYVAVVDANLASLKSDAVVSRSIRYAIAPSPDGFVGSVAITYENHGTFTWKTTRYRTYTRVYLPAGTTLLGADGAMVNDKLHDPAGRAGHVDVGEELGRAVFGAFISIEPGETKTLQFRFRLASSVVQKISEGVYALDVDKQAGTAGHPLTLDLEFGKKLTNASPAEDSSQWGDTRYRVVTDLRANRHFDVSF